MSKDKRAPLLKKDLENEQNITNQDYQGEPNSKPKAADRPSKDDPKDVPESNDPAGYDNNGNTKETPSGQRKND